MTSPSRLTLLMSLIALLFSLPAAATSLLPISLDNIAARAERIFHGKVIANEVRRDPISGNIATFTTFEVIESVKGETDLTHTIKQIGGEMPGGGARQVIHGVPRFSTGQEYVVFLPKASSLGFASPIGLSQGKFDVHNVDGRPVINNRRARAAVTASPQQSLPTLPSALDTGRSSSEQPVQLPDFLQGIREMTGE